MKKFMLLVVTMLTLLGLSTLTSAAATVPSEAQLIAPQDKVILLAATDTADKAKDTKSAKAKTKKTVKKVNQQTTQKSPVVTPTKKMPIVVTTGAKPAQSRPVKKAAPKQKDPLMAVGGGVIVGFIAAYVYGGSLKAAMSNVASAARADEYMKPGSFQLSEQDDMFLYYTFVRVPKAKRQESNDTGGAASDDSNESLDEMIDDSSSDDRD